MRRHRQGYYDTRAQPLCYLRLHVAESLYATSMQE
jgi:hypothetical protein